VEERQQLIQNPVIRFFGVSNSIQKNHRKRVTGRETNFKILKFEREN
jgi:hypothetical protein